MTRALPGDDAGRASLEVGHPLEQVQPHAALPEPRQLRHRQHHHRFHPALSLAAPGFEACGARVSPR